MRRASVTTLAVVACSLLPPVLRAQDRGADEGVAGPREKLFVQRDLVLLAGFAGLTVAMWPLDESAARRLQEDPVQNRRLYSSSASFFRVLGAPVTVYTAAGMYGAGRIAKRDWLADAGLHVGESLVLAGVVTEAIKVVAGRARPRHFKDTLGLQPFDPDARDFDFGRGFGHGQFQSFPSGHTSVSFAFASALVSEIHRKRPQWTWWVGPVFYGGATLVGISRMYNNAHWASDVAVGAALGTFSGLKVVRFNHANPTNKLNRFFLGRDARGATRVGWLLLTDFTDD